MLSANRDGMGSGPSASTSNPYQVFKFIDIQTATRDFAKSLEIGRGGFGKVYIGNIVNGVKPGSVAIKRFDPKCNQGPKEFLSEVTTLSKLHHHNIVSFIGYCEHEKVHCEDEKEYIIVYEYLSNGTIHDHLHKHRTPLSWLRRLGICISAAHGLCYLHDNTGSDYGVIHGDFKSSNVLLNGWVSKISDFGLSTTCPKNQRCSFVYANIKGTCGCIDPIFCRTGQLSMKTDVYAFGVLLLEILCRKPVLGTTIYGKDMNLVRWAKVFIKKGNIKHITDPNIWCEISKECLKKYISIVESCLNENLRYRSTMSEVVVGLESILTLQKKLNSSLPRASSGKIFGRMVDFLPFSPNGGNFCISSSSLEEFRFDVLRKATQKFSVDSLLGEGSFGKVYLGWIDPKQLVSSEQGRCIAVAVKKLKPKSSPKGVVHACWQAEVEFLRNVDHPNIIKLLGYCRDQSDHLLVYECMPNRSFYDLLFPDAPDIARPLTWRRRLKIMIGVVLGLMHLHMIEFIHFNIRSRNILVAENFDAKLGGLSLAKHFPEGWGSHGPTRHCGPMAYEDPEYMRTGVVSAKSDIYCFGLVLLECLTGRHTFSFSSKIRLLVEDMNMDRINVKDIVDPRLGDDNLLEDASKCFALAMRCIADKPEDRPSIEEVLLSLTSVQPASAPAASP